MCFAEKRQATLENFSSIYTPEYLWLSSAIFVFFVSFTHLENCLTLRFFAKQPQQITKNSSNIYNAEFYWISNGGFIFFYHSHSFSDAHFKATS